ncbi:19975_t:CDS:2, partial [Gigaspora rosea]
TLAKSADQLPPPISGRKQLLVNQANHNLIANIWHTKSWRLLCIQEYKELWNFDVNRICAFVYDDLEIKNVNEATDDEFRMT